MEEYREALIRTDFIGRYPFDAQLNPERVQFYTNALKRIAQQAGTD